jgi:hypothetical protein
MTVRVCLAALVVGLMCCGPALAARSVTLAQEDATITHPGGPTTDQYKGVGLAYYEAGDTLVIAYLYKNGVNQGTSYGFVGSSSPKNYSALAYITHEAGTFTIRVDVHMVDSNNFNHIVSSPTRSVTH